MRSEEHKNIVDKENVHTNNNDDKKKKKVHTNTDGYIDDYDLLESNLSKDEIRGLKSLKKRIEAGEICVCPTDKSKRFAVLTREQYLKSGRAHTKKDKLNLMILNMYNHMLMIIADGWLKSLTWAKTGTKLTR